MSYCQATYELLWLKEGVANILSQNIQQVISVSKLQVFMHYEEVIIKLFIFYPH